MASTTAGRRTEPGLACYLLDFAKTWLSSLMGVVPALASQGGNFREYTDIQAGVSIVEAKQTRWLALHNGLDSDVSMFASFTET